jgi:hypothetical protein
VQKEFKDYLQRRKMLYKSSLRSKGLTNNSMEFRMKITGGSWACYRRFKRRKILT